MFNTVQLLCKVSNDFKVTKGSLMPIEIFTDITNKNSCCGFLRVLTKESEVSFSQGQWLIVSGEFLNYKSGVQIRTDSVIKLEDLDSALDFRSNILDFKSNITYTGKLAKKDGIRYGQNSQVPYLSFSSAYEHYSHPGESSWYNFTAFRKQARVVSEYLEKKDLFTVRANLNIRHSNNKVYLDWACSRIVLLPKPKKDEQHSDNARIVTKVQNQNSGSW